VVEHEEEHARRVFPPLEQEQMIGAEVEHGKKEVERGWDSPPPHRQRR
jgi:hypothetical protein